MLFFFLENEPVEMSLISKHSSRSSNRYHGLKVSENLVLTDKHDIPQYDESFSHEFYRSPGYIPHFSNNIDSGSEVSDMNGLTQTTLNFLLNTKQNGEI